MEMNLGEVGSRGGELSFGFVVRSNGDGYLTINGRNPRDRRLSGVSVDLDRKEYDKLKALIVKTDEAIEKFEAGGQMKRMRVSY